MADLWHGSVNGLSHPGLGEATGPMRDANQARGMAQFRDETDNGRGMDAGQSQRAKHKERRRPWTTRL
jgi:hypothetical protein